jgi:hypothetical protein
MVSITLDECSKKMRVYLEQASVVAQESLMYHKTGSVATIGKTTKLGYNSCRSQVDGKTNSCSMHAEVAALRKVVHV